MSFWDLFCVGPVTGLIDSFVKNVFCEPVTPQRGAILRCDLLCGRADHTGIYLGNGRIAELNGDGYICEGTTDEFRSGSLARTGMFIYVACDGSSEQPLCSEAAAARAEAMLGTWTDYNILLNNCHEFTSGCVTGEFANSDTAFWMLELTIADHLNGSDSVCWRSWDR